MLNKVVEMWSKVDGKVSKHTWKVKSIYGESTYGDIQNVREKKYRGSELGKTWIVFGLKMS